MGGSGQKQQRGIISYLVHLGPTEKYLHRSLSKQLVGWTQDAKIEGWNQT